MLYGYICGGSNEFFVSSNYHSVSEEDIDKRFVSRMGRFLASPHMVTHANDSLGFNWNESFSLNVEILPHGLLNTKMAMDILFVGKAIKLCQIHSVEVESYKVCSVNGICNIMENDLNLYQEGWNRNSKKSDAEIYRYFCANDCNSAVAKKSDTWKGRRVEATERMGISSNMIKRIEYELYNVLTCSYEFSDGFEYLLSALSGDLSSSVWSFMEKRNSSVQEKIIFFRNTYLLGSGEFFHILICEALNAVDVGMHFNESSSCQNVLRRTAQMLNFDDETLSKIVSIRSSNPSLFSLLKPMPKDFFTSVRGSCLIEDEYINFSCPDVESINTLSSTIWMQCFGNTFLPEEVVSRKYLEGSVAFSQAVHVMKGFSGFLCYQHIIDVSKDILQLISSTSSSNDENFMKVGSLATIYHFHTLEEFDVKIGVELGFIVENACNSSHLQPELHIRLFFEHTWCRREISGFLDQVDCVIPLSKLSLPNNEIILEFEYARTNMEGRDDLSRHGILKARICSRCDYTTDLDNRWDLEVPAEFPLEQGSHVSIEIYAWGIMHESSILRNSGGIAKRIHHCTWKLLDIRFEGHSVPFPFIRLCSKLQSLEVSERLNYIFSHYQQCMNLSLKFKAPALVDVLLDSRSLRTYSRMFLILLKLKMASVALQKVWLQRVLVHNRLFQHTRHIMHFYITSLLFHFQINVVESCFIQSVQKMESQHDIASVIQTHKSFLNSISSMSMVDTTAIWESMDKALQLSMMFLAVCHLANDETLLYVPDNSEIRVILSEFSVIISYLIHLMQKSGCVSQSTSVNPDSGYLSGLMKKLATS